ncbi:hypothetical protein J2S74_003081 [Evansella vedderi]|uniref:Uncharacterized protein n=1 Tax=Evansella vedderi TaxID=38282 RepID=A0ABT9ZXX5_9BACI|nr:hypothetical protein [Evansella vedderi]MDQ0255699.1 hypothetical protein [Evansella vedderi]
MAKYKRKRIVVDAVRITRPITIETSKGTMKGNPGDFLITDKNGEQYPCESELFYEMYEPVKGYVNVKSFMGKSWRKLKQKIKENEPKPRKLKNPTEE